MKQEILQQNDRLPTELPFKDFLRLYGARLKTFVLIVIGNALGGLFVYLFSGRVFRGLIPSALVLSLSLLYFYCIKDKISNSLKEQPLPQHRSFVIRFYLFANTFTFLSGVFTILLTAWALGPEGRGELAVIVLWPNVIALLVNSGLRQAHIYYLAREPEMVSVIFSNALLYAVGMGAVAYYAAEFIVPNLVGVRSPEVMWLVRLCLLNIPLALLYDLMAGCLQGKGDLKYVELARVISSGIQSAACLMLWWTNHLTAESAAITMISAQLISSLTMLISVLYILRPRWQPSWAAWRQALGYGWRYHHVAVIAFVTFQLDQLLLGGMVSSVEFGLYSIAVFLSGTLTVLVWPVPFLLNFNVSSATQDGETVQLLTKSLRQTIYISVLMLIPLLLGAPLVLRVVFGSEFLAASGTLRVLLLASSIWAVGTIVIYGLGVLGYPGFSTMAQLASVIVTVVALLYWLPRYGIVGAAFSSLLGYSMRLVVALFWLLRKQRLTLWDCLRPQREDLWKLRIGVTLPFRKNSTVSPTKM